MVGKKLKQYGQSKGWYLTPDSVFGLYKGYCVTIAQTSALSNPQYKTIIFDTEKMSTEQVNGMQTVLQRIQKENKNSLFQVGETGLSVSLFENLFKIKAEKLDAILDTLFNELEALGVGKPFAQVDTSTLGYYNLSGNGVILTKDQYQTINAEINRANVQEQLERTSYFNGFLGSLLFALPVIAVWVAFTLWLNVIAGFLALLVSFLGYLGYEKFNGKLGPLTKWLLVVSNIIVITAANLASLYFEVRSFGFSLAEAIDLVQNHPETKSVFLQNLGISFVFAVVAWVWIFGSVSVRRNYVDVAEAL